MLVIHQSLVFTYRNIYLHASKIKRTLFLNSKPRRSLYKLQLKFVQTTRVVCTDYG